MSTKKPVNPFLEISKKCGITPYGMEEIVLDKMGLTSINKEDLKLFPNLQVIYLTNNNLTELSGLNYCIRLEAIDARQNKISHINLPKQTFLKELYLANNKFQDIETFINEASNLRNLKILDLRDNLVTQVRGYRQAVIAKFQSLEVLDGLAVTKYERAKATAKLNSRSSRIQKRSCSMLQYLQTAPLSQVDTLVNKRAEKIRENRKNQEKKEKEEQDKIERQMKEDFAKYSMMDAVPLPDSLDFLKKKNEGGLGDSPVKQTRAKSRMYIKMATFAEKNTEFDDDASRFEKLNPDLSGIAMDLCLKENVVFPK